jgi:TPR repeat protein
MSGLKESQKPKTSYIESNSYPLQYLMKIGSGYTLEGYLQFIHDYAPHRIEIETPTVIHDELENHNASELYSIGVSHLHKREFDQALYYLENSVERKFKLGNFLVGMFYEDGNVVDRNLKKAFKCYTNSIDSPESSFRVGLFLFHGCEGISQNKKDGLEIIMKTSQSSDVASNIHARKFLRHLDFIDKGDERNYIQEQEEKKVQSWSGFANFMIANHLNPSNAKHWDQAFQIISKMKNEMEEEVEQDEGEDENSDQLENKY